MQAIAPPTGDHNPHGYTTSEVLRALRGIDGTRRLSFRYELLDATNVKIGDLDNVIEASVSQNWLADIKRTARFRLRADGKIDFLSNRIKPWVRLHMPRKQVQLPFTINPSWRNRVNGPDGEQVTVDNSGASGDPLGSVTGTVLYDGSWSADGQRSARLGSVDGTSEAAFTFPAGTRTVWALRAYLFVPSGTRLALTPYQMEGGPAGDIVIDDIDHEYRLGSVDITTIRGQLLDRPVRLEIATDGYTAIYRLYWTDPYNPPTSTQTSAQTGVQAVGGADFTATEPSTTWDPIQTITVTGKGRPGRVGPAPQPILARWSGRGLTPGTTITTSTAGDGDTPFTLASTGFTVAEGGPRPPRIQMTQQPSATAQLIWRAAVFGQHDQYAVRMYCNLTAYPSAGAPLLQAYGSADSQLRWRLDLTSTGLLRLRDAGNTIIATAATSLPVAVNLRVEVVVDGTAATVTVHNGDQTGPPMVQLSGTVGATADAIRYGNPQTAPTWPTLYLYDLAISDRAEPIGPTIAPVNLVNTADGGAVGAAVTPTNSGGGSGNVWNTVITGGSGSLTYSGEQARGTLSYKITGDAASDVLLGWEQALGTQTEEWGRVELYLPSVPSGNWTLVWLRNATSQVMQIRLNPTGRLELLNTTGAVIAASAAVVAIGRWVRIEWHCIARASGGTATVSLYNDVDAVTPTETIGSSNAALADGITRRHFGRAAGAGPGIAYLDNIAVSIAGPVGPSSPIAARPAIDSITYGTPGPTHELAPEATSFVEWPQGVFLLSTPTREADASDVVTRDVEGYDQLQVYSDDLVVDRYTVAAGTAYTTAVSTLLGSIAKRITPSAATLPTAREWEPGTSKLKIINELLSAINYESLSFDEDGVAVVEPYVSPAERHAEYTYADDAVSVMTPEVSQEFDLFNIPNRWVLVVSDPDRPPLTAVYTNNDPASPTSTLRRQRIITDFRTEEDAADQAALNAKAARLAFEASQVYEAIEFTTWIMPIHSGNDVYKIVYGPLAVNATYAEQSWEMPLKAGSQMKHRARRVVSISDGGA
ncbi:hypothetical protein [Actinomadura miaoliensis]|uniref:LamG domain-containing protein n=1 Tax=Actinomadura miaoliensis TaxID=430685 RepID=A0ABP7W8X6_9ACTN